MKFLKNINLCMSKSKFIGLIFMMLLSLTGIIWVQIVWINNALSIRNENFNRDVFVSLDNAANAIESNREMSFFFDDPLMFNPGSGDISSYLSIGSYSSNDGKNFNYSVTSQTVTGTMDSTGKISYNKPVISRTDTTFYTDSGTINYYDPGGKGGAEYRKRMKVKSDPFRHLFPLTGRNLLTGSGKDKAEFQNMSDQMISEVYQWEKTMELNNDEVNYALRRSFMFAGIETPFEFAVIKDGKVQDGTFRKSDKKRFPEKQLYGAAVPGQYHQAESYCVSDLSRTDKLCHGVNGMASGRIVALLANYSCNIWIKSVLYYQAEKNIRDEI